MPVMGFLEDGRSSMNSIEAEKIFRSKYAAIVKPVKLVYAGCVLLDEIAAMKAELAGYKSREEEFLDIRRGT